LVIQLVAVSVKKGCDLFPDIHLGNHKTKAIGIFFLSLQVEDFPGIARFFLIKSWQELSMAKDLQIYQDIMKDLLERMKSPR
jgi:hypothetical protein